MFESNPPDSPGESPGPPPYSLLSVVVPVYNERPTVAEVIRRIRAVDLPVDVEVIVVDDGSTDGTDKILAAVGDSTVRVITHPHNRGKGAAVRTGLEVIRGDLVIIQDADLEYDPDDWLRLLDPILRGQGPGRLRQPLHRGAQEHAAHALDREPPALVDHQRSLLVHPLRHGDLLQALR
jgi:glycosyltransferase involved in cell wall biosynthesis